MYSANYMGEVAHSKVSQPPGKLINLLSNELLVRFHKNGTIRTEYGFCIKWQVGMDFTELFAVVRTAINQIVSRF